MHTEGQTDRQIDRHDEANNRFSQICKSTEQYTVEKHSWFPIVLYA